VRGKDAGSGRAGRAAVWHADATAATAETVDGGHGRRYWHDGLLRLEMGMSKWSRLFLALRF